MNRTALVLGSNGPQWQERLRFAESDAAAVGACLADVCDFTLPPLHQYGDAHDVMRHITQVSSACLPGDDLVIYFSGHGENFRGKLFLLWDTTTTNIFDSAINVGYILEALTFSQASQKLLILDCCHAGRAVGFKGTSDLKPILGEEGNHLVLCAASHIEKAREFEDLAGSFLAVNAVRILRDTTQPTVTLTELTTQLRESAIRHNALDRLRIVPEPYLFGEQRTPFTLKKPQGPPSVEVRMRSLWDPDMATLRRTLEPFAKWDPVQVRDHLPVRFVPPPEFTDRAATLRCYVETDKWPCYVVQNTKEQCEEVAGLAQRVEKHLTNALRTAIADTIQFDGFIDEETRDSLLEWYVSAKVCAMMRVVRSMWLINEPSPSWGAGLEHMSASWSVSVISGLTVVAKRKYQHNFWTDARISVDDLALPIYVPYTYGCPEEIHDLTEEAWRELIFPQLLDRCGPEVYLGIRALLTEDAQRLYRRLTLKAEQFLDTQSHNENEAKVTRNVALAAIERLKELPLDKRRAGLYFFRRSILKTLRYKIEELMPEIRAING